MHSQSDLLILFGPHPDLYCIQRKLGFIQPHSLEGETVAEVTVFGSKTTDGGTIGPDRPQSSTDRIELECG